MALPKRGAEPKRLARRVAGETEEPRHSSGRVDRLREELKPVKEKPSEVVQLTLFDGFE